MIINALIQLGVSPAEESNVADANALMGAWGKYQIQMLSERIPREKIIIPLHREDIEDIPVGATSISYAVVDDDKAIGAIEEEIARIKIAYGLVSPALGKNTPVPEIAYQPQAHSIIEQSDISQRQNPGAPRAHAEEEGTNWVLGLTHSDIGTIADRLTKFFWKSPEGCPQLPQSVTAQNFHDALAAYMERMIESRKGPAQHLAEYGIHLSRGMFFRHLPQGDGLTITSALSEHSYFSVTYVFRENGTMSPPATAVVKMPATIVSSAMPGKKDIKKNAASPAGKKTVGRDAAGRGTMEGISASPTGDGDKASLPADPEKAKKIILVVDDDYDFRTSLVEYLRGSLNEDDIEIVTAGNKKEALQILAGNQHIKFVLSDTRMPRPNDGFELAGTVRERYPGLPFYLMSSYIANEHREAEAAGKIDGFISKLRVGDTAFLEMIKKHLVSSSPSDFGTAEIGTNKLFSPEGEKNLGGIKMSGIPVISSPTSQKIEFAAIGPDFFERLTFRIVSMKHIASLAQFASVP
jgi:CheY-like chemotaxis protein